MRAENIAKVHALLKKSKEPLPATDIAALTGLSYNTARGALERLRAVGDDSHPRLWTLGTGREPATVAGRGERTVSVPLDGGGKWPSRWADGRTQFARSLGVLDIAPDADPAKLREEFIAGAKVLGSIAWELGRVLDRPDWYTAIGGEPTDD